MVGFWGIFWSLGGGRMGAIGERLLTVMLG